MSLDPRILIETGNLIHVAAALLWFYITQSSWASLTHSLSQSSVSLALPYSQAQLASSNYLGIVTNHLAASCFVYRMSSHSLSLIDIEFCVVCLLLQPRPQIHDGP